MQKGTVLLTQKFKPLITKGVLGNEKGKSTSVADTENYFWINLVLPNLNPL